MRLLMAAVVVPLFLAGAVPVFGTHDAAPRPTGTDAAVTPHVAAKAAASSPPTTPPARICGSRSLRRGPVRRPPKAVAVRPRQRLDAVVRAHRAGTTFWLRPGTYTLGRGQYGQVVPKSGDTIIGAPGVVLDGQRANHYAFAGHATKVTLEYLTIKDFGTSILDDQQQGVVNHDAGHGWLMEHLTVADNGGAGVFLGTGDTVRDSCLKSNGQYGFSAYAASGVSHLKVIHNEIADNDTANWETRQPGCGCTGGGKFWDVRDADVINNYVHNNHSVGLWADTDNTGFLFRGNYISGNADEGLTYEISYNAEIVANTFRRNALKDGPLGGFDPALYISESGSDPRAGSRFGTRFLIAHNRFVDNYSGVMLWENSNRFAGSADNSSTDYSTLVNPKVATVSACAAHFPEKPYVDDCRWKTQNVVVEHDRFVIHPGSLPASCRPGKNGCGYNGVFSNYGERTVNGITSPYYADAVPDAITFHQHNRFRNNVYVGPWRYMAWELGDRGDKSWRQWRAAPYHQDTGSVRKSS